jgi:hypothetical protein
MKRFGQAVQLEDMTSIILCQIEIAGPCVEPNRILIGGKQ